MGPVLQRKTPFDPHTYPPPTTDEDTTCTGLSELPYDGVMVVTQVIVRPTLCYDDVHISLFGGFSPNFEGQNTKKH